MGPGRWHTTPLRRASWRQRLGRSCVAVLAFFLDVLLGPLDHLGENLVGHIVQGDPHTFTPPGKGKDFVPPVFDGIEATFLEKSLVGVRGDT